MYKKEEIPKPHMKHVFVKNLSPRSCEERNRNLQDKIIREACFFVNFAPIREKKRARYRTLSQQPRLTRRHVHQFEGGCTNKTNAYNNSR